MAPCLAGTNSRNPECAASGRATDPAATAAATGPHLLGVRGFHVPGELDVQLHEPHAAPAVRKLVPYGGHPDEHLRRLHGVLTHAQGGDGPSGQHRAARSGPGGQADGLRGCGLPQDHRGNRDDITQPTSSFGLHGRL